MKIELWVIGKTNMDYLKTGIAIYEKRAKRYLPFEIVVLPDVKAGKKTQPAQIKEKEGETILSKLQKGDALILLDENGKSFRSEAFAAYLQEQLQMSHKRLIFQIGGAYGFSKAVYERSNTKIALSKMTFSHQMIRLLFVEQFYRAMTILNHEPYHHS
ncbi:MAG: 23S rRNA (pseudouridine(1915)-N(3))-methyltransferase RlmH [Bacteroidota bacterium]